MKKNEMTYDDPINDFEKIINDYRDIYSLQKEVFMKNIIKLPICLNIILICVSFFIIFKSPLFWLPKWAGFIIYVFSLLLLVYFQLKNMVKHLQNKGINCENLRAVWNKITFFQDKTFYDQIIGMNYNFGKTMNLKKYVLLKIAEEKRRWTTPKIFTLGVIVAIAYSFLNIYLNKLSTDKFIIALSVFLIFSFFIFNLELMMHSAIQIFGKQDKYGQLLSSINVALIRLKENIKNDGT